jgi:flavin reductase (DIM6/NTAB) family NADH-FMN oxidoreductase RutF
MILDPTQLPPDAMYRVLISAVVPRPIAFVSTRSAAGAVNLAPFSYFTALSSRPPLIGISINDRGDDPKDTLRNIRETGEFVVNVVNRAIMEPMVATAGDWPRTVSEFEPSHLTPRQSLRVAPPSVVESPLQLECRLHQEIPLGNCFLVVGEVVLVNVDDAVMSDGRIDAHRLDAVGRLGGELYAPLGEVVKCVRPKVSRTTGEVEG